MYATAQPMRRIPFILPAAAVLPVGAAWLLAACGAGPPADDGATAADTLVAEVTATIGVVEGAPEYQFGDIRSVAADAAGRIYVADRIGSTLRVYGPDGRYLATIGRQGPGPGEFEWPSGLDFAPDGRLFVRDAQRITILAPREPGAVADSVAATWQIPVHPNVAPDRGAVTPDGRYLYPRSLYPQGELPRHDFVILVDGEPREQRLRVPAYPNLALMQPAIYPEGGICCRIAAGLNRTPFSPVPSWTPTPRGTVLSGDGIDYVLHETDIAGDTLRTIRGPDAARRAVPEAERADSARALRARLDELPVPLSEVRNVPDDVREIRLPERLPAFIGVHLAADGGIWVERWPPEGRGEERVYDVLDPDGELVAVVVVPAPLARDVPPFLTGDRIYGVVTDPETGVERVVAATVARPLADAVATTRQ